MYGALVIVSAIGGGADAALRRGIISFIGPIGPMGPIGILFAKIVGGDFGGLLGCSGYVADTPVGSKPGYAQLPPPPGWRITSPLVIVSAVGGGADAALRRGIISFIGPIGFLIFLGAKIGCGDGGCECVPASSLVA